MSDSRTRTALDRRKQSIARQQAWDAIRRADLRQRLEIQGLNQERKQQRLLQRQQRLQERQQERQLERQKLQLQALSRRIRKVYKKRSKTKDNVPRHVVVTLHGRPQNPFVNLRARLERRLAYPDAPESLAAPQNPYVNLRRRRNGNPQDKSNDDNGANDGENSGDKYESDDYADEFFRLKNEDYEAGIDDEDKFKVVDHEDDDDDDVDNFKFAVSEVPDPAAILCEVLVCCGVPETCPRHELAVNALKQLLFRRRNLTSEQRRMLHNRMLVDPYMLREWRVSILEKFAIPKEKSLKRWFFDARAVLNLPKTFSEWHVMLNRHAEMTKNNKNIKP